MQSGLEKNAFPVYLIITQNMRLGTRRIQVIRSVCVPVQT